jgi:DNA polymerase III alpha subunit
VLEGLVCSGALIRSRISTAINLWRAALCAQTDSALAGAARTKKARALDKTICSDRATAAAVATSVRADINPWTLVEMLAAEKKALGFYITRIRWMTTAK